MEHLLNIRIPFPKLISALSLALDLAETKKWEHSRRTSYFALHISKVLEIPDEEIINVYYGSLLHDISKMSPMQDVNRMHPIVGAEIVNSLPFLRTVADSIRYHHEQWDGKGFPHSIGGNEIPLAARIIYLADQVENHSKGDYSTKQSLNEIRELITQGVGAKFDPMVAKAALECIDDENFWDTLNYPSLKNVLEKENPLQDLYLDHSNLEQVAAVFAKLIDSKSPFTYNHSVELANLAVTMGSRLGFSDNKLKLIHVSGLLHDIGKVVIPNEILDKPGRLTLEEFDIIKQHAYYTDKILSEAEGLGDITKWASQHHEKLDGSGYHRGQGAQDIPTESRIIAIADIYQALVADRPYRKGMEPEQAIKIIQESCDKNHLDGDLVPVLKSIVGI